MSKSKKFLWALALVAIIFIIVAILAKFGVINDGIFGRQNRTTKTETVTPAKTVTFKDKVIEHESEIIALQNTVDSLSRRLDALESACNNSSKTANRTNYKKTVVTTNQQKTNESSSTGDRRPNEIIENIYPVQKDGQPNNANLRYLEQDGKILLCITVNGLKDHYFPQFAMDRGVSFTSVKSNLTENGNNWEVEPVNEFQGDVGVTNSGIFYVKASLIATVMNANRETVRSVEILTSYTKWQPRPMVLLGDYWVFETQRP